MADIEPAFLPWKLEVQIRPGRVRAHSGAKQVADVSVDDATSLPATSPDYQGHNDNSAEWEALRTIAERRHAEGDEEAYLVAYMAAIGHPEWRSDANRGDSGIDES